MAQTPRSSALVENLNSRLRTYFTRSRPLGGSYLRLLQFLLNHRRFMRSRRPERVGKSPRQLMTGQGHSHELTLLGGATSAPASLTHGRPTSLPRHRSFKLKSRLPRWANSLCLCHPKMAPFELQQRLEHVPLYRSSGKRLQPGEIYLTRTGFTPDVLPLQPRFRELVLTLPLCVASARLARPFRVRSPVRANAFASGVAPVCVPLPR